MENFRENIKAGCESAGCLLLGLCWVRLVGIAAQPSSSRFACSKTPVSAHFAPARQICPYQPTSRLKVRYDDTLVTEAECWLVGAASVHARPVRQTAHHRVAPAGIAKDYEFLTTRSSA